MINDKFLKEQKILHLGTIDPKGNPHIVPVWYKYQSGKFYIGTNTSTKKVKNLKKNKRVSFCIDVGIKSPKIHGIMGTGTASLILNKPKVSKMVKKILLRYFKTLTTNRQKNCLKTLNV